MQQRQSGAVFFDRDGVLNRDTGFIWRAAEFQWTDGAPEAVRMVNEAGLYAFVVTNQSGVARGYYTEADVVALHQWIGEELARESARIDAFRYCPHHEEAVLPEYRIDCECRKPKAGMIADLLDTWPVDPRRCVLIGDRPTDLEAARAAGIAGFQFDGGNLADFVAAILKRPPFIIRR